MKWAVLVHLDLCGGFPFTFRAEIKRERQQNVVCGSRMGQSSTQKVSPSVSIHTRGRQSSLSQFQPPLK